jgi:hypothetical protein
MKRMGTLREVKSTLLLALLFAIPVLMAFGQCYGNTAN